LKLNGIDQLLVYANDVNVLGGSMYIADVCTETGLHADAKETEYMVMSRDQNAGQNHNIKIYKYN
jgi:hypothetical protein